MRDIQIRIEKKSGNRYQDPGFTILAFSGEEAVSKNFSFSVLLRLAAPTDLKQFLKKDGSVNLSSIWRIRITAAPATEEGGETIFEEQKRFIHCLTGQVEIESSIDEVHVSVLMVPLVLPLTKAPISRSFYEKSVLDLVSFMEDRVKTVAPDAGGLVEFDYAQLSEGLADSYEKWTTRVQFQESDWSFLSRILERDGIYFFIQNDEQKASYIFVDEYLDHSDIAKQKNPLSRSDAGVLNIKIKTEAVPDRVSVAGYQWHNGSQNWASLETSNLDNEPTTTRPEKDEEWQAVSYEGLISPVTKAVTEIITKDLKHLAQVRTEEVVGSATCYTCLSSNPLISAGSLIQIAGFDDILQKDDVLFVTQVAHQTEISPSDGTIAYRNTFSARLYSTSDQDKSVVQYRPPRLTPRPKIDGAIIAFIEAYRYPETANSHEVKRDDFGRFNIVFQFDAYAATDASKVLHPVRAVQRSAGQRGASYRAQYSGTEVGVVFIDGDPDRPFVLGAFHNGVDQDPTLNWPRSTSLNI
jgi:uncharacterized protein involved in type VI secretion and phage assembly